MLQEGVIKESTSHSSSLIIVVPNSRSLFWLCNDLKKLNAISEFNSYPLLCVDDLVVRLGRFIYTLDLTKGYGRYV